MLDVFLDFLLGMVLGCLGGLFGIGGGLLAIPALGVIFGLDQQLAQGTALVMVVPNVVLALWRYHQRNRIDPRQAGVLALTGLLCAFLASSVAARIDAARMREAFVIFLLALAGYMFWRLFRRPPQGGATPRYGLPWMGVLGLGAGSLGGLFGVGGGVLATPVLTSVFGLAQVVAQGLALALAAPSTAVALGTYAMHGHGDWRMGIPLALGGLLSISWGVRLAHALPERSLRMAFCAFLALCAVLLLVRG
ncbi:sulfite exporter TauE/SafE family protein [Pseudomonas aeruginosa]|nr:sulfite exporter TauE/SafE family protein [Pseudomonas aeruginosa]